MRVLAAGRLRRANRVPTEVAEIGNKVSSSELLPG
jgi:hypothetical protein